MGRFLGMLQKVAEAKERKPRRTEFVLQLAEVTKQWGELTMEIGKKAMSNADEIGAASYDYLYYSGYVVLAYWWARSVATANESSHGEDFKTMKLETARFYFARVLPRIHAHASAMRSGASTTQALNADLFDS